MKRISTVIGFFLCALGFGAGAAQPDLGSFIPRLVASQVGDRYAAQMELQALVAQATRSGAEKERVDMASALAARAADTSLPQAARVWLVRQLELCGAAECVPALAGLLQDADAELREGARRALEKNSAASARDALSAALRRGGETIWQIGLIHSLGERADSASVELLAQKLREPALAPTVATALGTIATEPAEKTLWSAFDKTNAAFLADALVLAGDRLQSNRQATRAAAIYEKLYRQCAAVQLRSAALVGLGATDPARAKELIPAALADADPVLQTAAITAAREVHGKALPQVLAEMAPKLPPAAKVLVFRELDASAEKLLLGMLADPDENVRLAALENLGRIGSAASVPTLVKCAADSQGAPQKVAAAGLVSMPGPGVDAALLKLSGRGNASFRAAAIKALADRNCRSAVPSLLSYAADTNRPVSAAACAALGKLGSDAEIEPVAKLALAGTTAGAEDALQTLVTHVNDQAAAASQLAALAKSASPSQAPVLFGALAALSGNEALQALTAFANSGTEETKDAAVRALANWPDFAGARPLLDIASNPQAKPLHNALAVQGVARLVRSSDRTPADTRVDTALAALKVAQRQQDKALVISALGSVANAKAATALRNLLSDPQLKTPAGQAALTLADTLSRRDKNTAKELAQAVKQANLSDSLNRKADGLLKRN